MTQKTLITTFDSDFVQRTLRTTCIVLIIMFLFGLYYFPFYDVLGFLSAGVWSIINMIFLSALVRTVVRPEGIDKLAAAVLIIMKFPILYVTAYFIFTAEIFSPWPLVLGISMVLVVMVLKAFSRVMLGLDEAERKNQTHGMAL